MSINTTYEEEDIGRYSGFKEYAQLPTRWFGRDISLVVPKNHIGSAGTAIQNSGTRAHYKIKPMGEGTYEIEIEKDVDGETSVGGSISYETDSGVKVEAEVKVDTGGNASGSVKVGGSF